MAKNKNKKGETTTDILESPDLLRDQLTKTEQFFERNKVFTFSVFTAIMLVIIGYFLFRYYIRTQDEKAQKDMFQAIYYYEADSLNKALQGDGNNFGFTDIIDNYPMTKSAKLAHYYAGSIYLKKGDFDNALKELSKFKSNDIAVQARAYALIGDAHMEKGETSEAISFYTRAAEFKSNQFFTPLYLEKAAIAYEKLKNYESASDCYNEIITKYSESNEVQNARKQKARMDGLAKK